MPIAIFVLSLLCLTILISIGGTNILIIVFDLDEKNIKWWLWIVSPFIILIVAILSPLIMFIVGGIYLND